METIQWNGYTIQTDFHAAPTTPSLPGVGNGNMWQPINTKVVGNDLQLSIERNGVAIWEGQQVWAAAEAVIQEEAKFGQYCVSFKVTDANGDNAWEQFSLDNSTPNITTIFGIFLYNESGTGGTNTHDEIDFLELGFQNQQNTPASWINTQPGGPTATNAQNVIQPWSKDNKNPDWDNLHRFAIDISQIPSSGEVTILADWSAQGSPVQFQLAYGAYTKENFPTSGTLNWTSPPAANSAVPGEHPDTKLHINLWPYGGPATNSPVYVRVTNLQMP